jgi:hypothetical protein
MSANDFRIHREQTRRAAPDKEQTWEAVVTATPHSTTALVRVRTVNGARGRAGVELGLAPWIPPAGKPKPEEGDLCLVQLDEQGSPWVVGWKKQEASVGEWKALALSSAPKVKQRASRETLGTRTEEDGASCRLRGQIEADGAVMVGTTVFTLPAGHRPKAKLELGVLRGSGTIVMIVETNGVVTLNTELKAAEALKLDGLTFNLT